MSALFAGIPLKVIVLIALFVCRHHPSVRLPRSIRACTSSTRAEHSALSRSRTSRRFSTSRALGPVLLNSACSIRSGAALVALTVGAVQAWLAERTDASLRQILYVASIISLGIPYVLYIVAWLLLLGKAGPVNAILQQLFGGAGPYINVYSLGGMIFIEGMLWSPLAFLLLSPVFRNSDASFEEAASMCGAGLFSTLRTSRSAWCVRRCWRSACLSSSRRPRRSRCRRWSACPVRRAS